MISSRSIQSRARFFTFIYLFCSGPFSLPPAIYDAFHLFRYSSLADINARCLRSSEAHFPVSVAPSVSPFRRCGLSARRQFFRPERSGFCEQIFYWLPIVLSSTVGDYGDIILAPRNVGYMTWSRARCTARKENILSMALRRCRCRSIHLFLRSPFIFISYGYRLHQLPFRDEIAFARVI